jgi:adenosylcobinamide-phosphate synthase
VITTKILILAVIFDLLLGDPGGKYHPVALIGRLISYSEKFLYKQHVSPKQAFLRGMLAAISVIIFVTVLITLIIYFTKLHYVGVFIQAILLSFAISLRTLVKRGIEIADDLKNKDIGLAKQKLSYIVSRDTEQMLDTDIIRATVETMAENFVDGIVAPLFWFLVFGLPGAFLYRTANTLDAMFGYRNDRYEYFGKFSARLDDVLNFIPARIGGIVLLIAGFCLKLSPYKGMQTWLRYASSHPSPNSGIPEAVIAGMLGLRLGGYNYYDGKKYFRAHLGLEYNAFQYENIKQLRNILYCATFIYTILLTAALQIENYF